MGNGIPFNICCSKENNNIKDIDINKVNSNVNTVKDLNSPGKEMHHPHFEDMTKTDISGNKFKGNNDLSIYNILSLLLFILFKSSS